MASSFSALWGAPPVICADGAVLTYGLWVYDHPKGSMRLACALYRSRAGDLILRVWRNGQIYREWRGDESTLRHEAEENRLELESEGWKPVE